MKRSQPHRGGGAQTCGFSLVELLVVAAIVVVLMAAAIPALSSFANAGKATQNIVSISGAMERARDYAVSRNTYTWVAFSTTNATQTNPMRVAIFASLDGSLAGVDLDAGSGQLNPVPGARANLAVVDRIAKIEDARLLSATNGVFPTGPAFSYGTTNFGNSVMFTPAGEARISKALPAQISFRIVPLQGSTAKEEAAATVEIAGLTGRVNVERP